MPLQRINSSKPVKNGPFDTLTEQESQDLISGYNTLWTDRSPANTGTSISSLGPGYLVAPFSDAPGQVRTTLTGFNTNSYILGNWYLQHNTGSNNIQTRTYILGDSTPPISYFQSSYYAQINNNSAGAAGILLAQPVEALLSGSLRGNKITFNVSAQISAGTGILKVAIFEWTGTADSSSCKNLVASWASNVPTFNTTTLSKVASTSITLSSTGWGTASVSVVSGITANNYIVAIWVEGLPAGVSIYLSTPGLYMGSAPSKWVDRPSESKLLERYYEISYNSSTALATGSFPVGYYEYQFAQAQTSVSFPVRTRKRLSPAVTIYSANTGTAGSIRGSAGDVTATTVSGPASILVTPSTPQAYIGFHYALDARI